MNKFTLSLSLLFLIFLSCREQKTVQTNTANSKQAVKDSLTLELDSILHSAGISGFAVAIANQNGILYNKGFGYANQETKEKYTQNTIQHIASISKTLIGLALMKAQELEKLQLDEPINKYLPFKVVNPFHPDESISIRHLATHTSGINDTKQYMDNAWVITPNQDLTNINTDYPAQKLNMPEKDLPMEAYLKGYLAPKGKFFEKDNFINFKPGERYNYSNIGASLVALVIEKATGKAFDTFTAEHILKPLKMTSSGWSLKDIDIKQHATLYRTDNSPLPFYKAITYPDGMLICVNLKNHNMYYLD